MASTGQTEDSEEEKREDKRKREEESITGSSASRKRRATEESGSEDEGLTSDSSQDSDTSSPYARLTISRFTIHQVLGRGSFGKVVLASVPGRNIYTAVKIIDKKWDNADTITRERRILLATRACPFLCHLYAAHQSQERAYFITEYLSGGSLEALINMCGYLNTDSVRFYTAELVCGLQFLHGHNIVHRDLKPLNIMLDADGHIRIIDLGLAQDGVTASNKIRGVTGSLYYMAPEILLRKSYSTAVDWWSLGIVVSRMASGHHPFHYGPFRKTARTAITTHEPNIPSWLHADVQHLVAKLLCKKPKKRLGVRGNIRMHPLFSTIGWKELEERRARPPFTPFQRVLEKQHLCWPKDKKAHHPVAEFSYMSPSWARWMRRSGL
ncbi:protein kinase C delta type-like [Bufo gargarizans]|uniref:protein kinase C delta type-like n=1 Tax=Bufo gargarizans TaxID=30331 RepID=UPI001CF317F7|nr:protein kinase C delta type-like [Bufo gargarizans]